VTSERLGGIGHTQTADQRSVDAKAIHRAAPMFEGRGEDGHSGSVS
jgi:hypothetical protein